MIGNPGNDESASTKESRPSRVYQSNNNSINQGECDRSEDEEISERRRPVDSSVLPLSTFLQLPSSLSLSPEPPLAPSTIQANSSHEQGQSISPPPPSGTRSRSMSLVPGLDILSPLIFSGIGGGGGSGGVSSAGKPSAATGRKNSFLTERTPQFMTVAPSFTTRNGPWSQQDPLARARKSIDVRSFPSYLARKRQSIIGARLFDTLVEVAGSPLQPITPEAEDNEETRSSTDNNSHKNGDSRGSRKSLVHRLRGNRKSIEEEEPEAPTLSLGERVAWLKTKGPEFGTVRWIGRLPKVSASWTVGVEFDNAIGSADGKFEGRRYFTAKESFARFLPLSSLTRVDNIIGRQRSGTLLSRMSVQLKPGQLISVQRESENNLPIHCALNAPHHIDHDVHVPNMNHCLCNNCNHPCAHLCKTKKPKGRKTDMAHMCHFSQKPHNKLCCGGEELLYSLASAQDLELNGSLAGGIGNCSGRRGRRVSSPSGGDSTSGNGHGPGPNGCSISSHRRRSGRSDGSRRRSSGSSSTIRRLRDKSLKINSVPTSTERKAESQATTEGNKDECVISGNGDKDNGDEKEANSEVIVVGGEEASCQEGVTQLNPFTLSKLKSGSELSVSSLPSTGASQVEVYIARGALTDESDLDDDDRYQDDEEYDDDGCSSGLVSSQGRHYLRGKRGLPSHTHHQSNNYPNQRHRRRRRHHHHHYRRSGTGGSRSIITTTGRSSRSSRRRYSSDGGTQITSGGGDGCSGPSRRSGKRSGLRSLVSCLVPSIPNSYKKSGKSSNKKSKSKNSTKCSSSSSRRQHDDEIGLNQLLQNHHLGQVNCDLISYPYYPCSCDGHSPCIPQHPGHLIDESTGEISSSTGHLLAFSGQESNEGDFDPYLHHYLPLPLAPLSSSSSLQKQQQTSTDHRHYYYPHSHPHHHHQSLAHFNSTRHSSASSSHHHHHHQSTITCSSSSSRRQPQPQPQPQLQHRHHSQRKHHGLSTSPEPDLSPVNNKTPKIRSSTLIPHSSLPATTFEDNLAFGVGAGLTGRASPCGHFYYSPCAISASQSSIGASQKYSPSTKVTSDHNHHHHHHHHHHHPKQQANNIKNKQLPSSDLEKSANLNPTNQKCPQLKSSSSSSSSQQLKHNQCTEFVDLEEKLLVDLKTVQPSSKVNNDDNFMLDLTAFSLNCEEVNSNNNSSNPTKVTSNCLTSSSLTSTIKTSSVNNYQSALHNQTNHNKNFNHCSNEINNNNVKYNNYSIEEINNDNHLNQSNYQFNGVNHNLIFEANNAFSESVPEGNVNGKGSGGNHMNINQHFRHHESNSSTQSPTSSATMTQAKSNGLMNGENVLFNESNCSYINHNNSSNMNTIKIEVELTRSPSIQSYTSNSMISPRRKRKGPAPPPPIISTFEPFPGLSGISLSPPSLSSSSPSSLAVTPTHSPLPGPSNVSSSNANSTPSKSLITSKSSNVVNLYSCPSISGCSKFNDSLTMGRKKSIKNKPAPSPPPPLPTLPPLASRPKSLIQGASSKPHETRGAFTSSSPEVTNVNESSPSPSSTAFTLGHCSSHSVSTSCRNNNSLSSSNQSPTKHNNCRPVAIRYLPCRSHSVSVCPITTLTRSLSDQKQINGKNMLRSVTSYSSDLNLPKFTRLSGLINSPTGSSVFQHEQILESDSIIIKYDDPDYFYPMITNCYSSCELPYTIDNGTSESEIIHQQDVKSNCDHITVPTTPIRRKRQKEYKTMNKSQSFANSSLFSEAAKDSPSGLPPRPPSPRIDSNSYKIVNRSIPQIPVRTRQRSRPESICFANHCCRLDQSSDYKVTQNLATRSSSLNSMKSRSSPSTPNISHNLHSSYSLPRINSALTFTPSTLSESLPDNHQGENVTCTNCSLCGLKGATERRSEMTRTTKNNELEIMKSKDETVFRDEKSTIEEPIYEEIDFGLISENVAALLSPRQLMNSANNKLRCRGDKNTTKNVNDSGEMMMTSYNNKINITPIDTLKGRKMSSSGSSGGERKDDAMMEKVIGHHNSGGEILSDTSDDRVTVKSMNSHNNNNQLKPWAYSSSSLDSEQSTTSSGSTVKQWANQIVSYSSKNHCQPLQGGSSGSTPTTSSTCYHGDHPTLYRIQCIGHHHFHHNDENNQKQHHQNHHPHLVSLSPSSTPEQRQHFYHCPHHLHHLPHHRHYHHHGHRMITTSTSDHSLSSLSSSNFSEDPTTTTTPTPPNILTALHDDYNFIYLPNDSPVGHHCSDLDETNEDEDEDEDVTVDEDDVEEEEVMICDGILIRGEAKNDFGKRTCCYSDPFYQTQDLQGDDDDNDDGEDGREVDGDHGGRNKLKEKKTEEESVKGKDDEKISLETTPTSEVYSQKIESPICSTKLNDVKSVQISTESHFPSSLSSSNIHNSKKTRSLSSLNYHNRISCDQIAANQSTCHCHQCYHHSQQHFIGTRSYHQHRTNQNNYQQPTKTFNKSGSEDNMASSWNGNGPFANENYQNQTQNYNHNENNDGNNINRLMQELQLAINYGQHRKAALLARQLALRKVSCSFNQSTTNATATFGSNDQPIIVYLYIEDKQSRQGPFPIQLYPSMTVKMLKEKVEGDFGFPVNIQSWILGKCLATNEDALLSTFGIILSGCPIFLYLLSNNNTTDQVTINENNPLGQNLSTSTFGEKTQHDGNEDKSGNHDDQNQGNTTFITNDTKEMKGGKRSVSIAGKLSSNEESENINENHADHHGNNEKNDLVGGKSSSDIGSGSGSSGEVSKGLATSIDATISMRPIQRRSKGTKAKSTSSSPSTSKSTSKGIEIHGEDLNHHYPLSTLNQVKDQLIRKADKISIESPRRQNRKIQSTLKHNDIKMMQAHDYQASSSGASKLNNDNNKVNNINMIQKQQLLIINSIKNQGDNHSNDNNGSVNVDNEGNGCNKEAEKVGQQVKGDEDGNQTGDEDNLGDDNEPEVESKGEITETYKQLMALDDVDLVKNSEDFECPICFLNIHKEKGVVLRDCLHMFCRECLCNSVEFCDEALVKCPYRSDDYYCDITITEREIKSLASDELYQKHLARSMKAAELKSAKSFHCKTADCPGWCEYDDNVNTFPCPVCGKVNCLTCQAIHEEMNCRQYQDALEFEAAESNEDAKKTKQFLDNMLDKGEALRCPICFVILIKKWGCDWVKCSMCHSEICWVTKGPRWGPGGKGDISGGCKCMVNGQKCHPKCNYCH